MTTSNDALDFYPTPDSLAFDMVFSLREVKSGFTTCLLYTSPSPRD